MEQDPHCWYCGVEVYEYARLPDGTYAASSGDVTRPMHLKIPLPHDQATIEHLFSRSRWHQRLPVLPCPYPLGDQTVLACKQCNEARSDWGDLLMKAALSAS